MFSYSDPLCPWCSFWIHKCEHCEFITRMNLSNSNKYWCLMLFGHVLLFLKNNLFFLTSESLIILLHVWWHWPFCSMTRPENINHFNKIRFTITITLRQPKIEVNLPSKKSKPQLKLKLIENIWDPRLLTSVDTRYKNVQDSYCVNISPSIKYL